MSNKEDKYHECVKGALLHIVNEFRRMGTPLSTEQEINFMYEEEPDYMFTFIITPYELVKDQIERNDEEDDDAIDGEFEDWDDSEEGESPFVTALKQMQEPIDKKKLH